MNIDLGLISRATEHYIQAGCYLTSVPYLVDSDIMDFTCPSGVIDKRLTHSNGKQYVASAEQSFLQMEKDVRIGIKQPPMMALTPCYRDESVMDDTHLNIFLKLEIFEYNPKGFAVHYYWADRMVEFFKKEGLNTRIVSTLDGVDVITEDHLELGSFGYRISPLGVPYVYATGLAEPRASMAIAIEQQSKGLYDS